MLAVHSADFNFSQVAGLYKIVMRFIENKYGMHVMPEAAIDGQSARISAALDECFASAKPQ